jgi:hypothetical protein
VGDREQGNRRRKEERLGTRQEDDSKLGKEGRQEGWTRRGLALEILSIPGRPQGCFDPAEIDHCSKEHRKQTLQHKEGSLQ